MALSSSFPFCLHGPPILPSSFETETYGHVFFTFSSLTHSLDYFAPKSGHVSIFQLVQFNKIIDILFYIYLYSQFFSQFNFVKSPTYSFISIIRLDASLLRFSLLRDYKISTNKKITINNVCYKKVVLATYKIVLRKKKSSTFEYTFEKVSCCFILLQVIIKFSIG